MARSRTLASRRAVEIQHGDETIPLEQGAPAPATAVNNEFGQTWVEAVEEAQNRLAFFHDIR